MKKLLTVLAAVVLYNCIAGEIPGKFSVKCGDIAVGVSKRSFWNLNGIWYRGVPCCLADTAWYGTTTSYGKGWVGSGHLENGIGEKEVEVKFFLNGAAWIPTAGETVAESFEYEKTSKVGEMRLTYSVKVTGNEVAESVKMTMERAMGMTIYHYMHPWNRMFTEYLFSDRSGGSKSGVFAKDKREMSFLKNPHWFSGYSPAKNIGFVSAVFSISPITPDESFLMWNRLADRKLYFVPVREKKVPAGKEFHWVMKTVFFQAVPDMWQQQAASSAGKLTVGLGN